MINIDKRLLNFLVIIVLTVGTFWWTFFIFHEEYNWTVVSTVIGLRIVASFLLFKDYTLSWSKSTQKTFLLKSVVYVSAFVVYVPIFYGVETFSLLASELFLYLFCLNFSMYLYYFIINRSTIIKTKTVVIYGAGKAGIKIEEEFRHSEYRVKYFCDDEKIIQGRSIDAIRILSPHALDKYLEKEKYDLLVVSIPSASKDQITNVYERFHNKFHQVKILPSLNDMLLDSDFTTQLKDISVEDLLARHPKDLDKNKITSFLKDKVVLVTGAGGSIGSEISRQCIRFGVKKLLLLDHSEYNLYQIEQELNNENVMPIMQSVVNKEQLNETFRKYQPDIVIHAAAYKHVPLVESNIQECLFNNIMGTKNIIDCSIEYGVEKVVLISTDKAVRPTNVMGASKRISELYAQNANGNGTDIVAVRFGNVLGSSGSAIPKFKSQIEQGGPITVTHPDITRYFMLIPEACELVLQAGAIGTGGEIFILDMGEPIKIVDLANKMIELSGRDDIEIVYSGLRPGEKLYEELLIDDSDCETNYESITVAKPTTYNLDELNQDIKELLISDDKIKALQKIVPEFNHQLNC